MSTSRSLKTQTLRDELALSEKNYRETREKYLIAANPEEKNQHRGRMDAFLADIDRIESELRVLLSEVDALEGVDADSTVATENAVTERGKELDYVDRILDTYSHWGELYTDVSVNISTQERRVKVRSQVAEKYIQAQHAIFVEIDHEPSADYGKTVTVETFHALTEQIVKYKRLAILGDPGAGKTTTLQRLAYSLALEVKRKEDVPLPLFASLGAYKGGGFERFLESNFVGLDLKNKFPRSVILLLDGLNEMAVEHVSHIRTWLEENPEISAVVTCRKLDYIAYKLHLQRVDVLPLDVKRIYKFICNYLEDDDCVRLFWGLAGDEAFSTWLWHLRQENDSSFEAFWFGLIGETDTWDTERYRLKQIQEELLKYDKLPGLLGMVSNPFLLFAVIQIYIRTGNHPTNKGQLFHLFVTLLLEQRGKPAAITRPPWIDESIQRECLSRFAYRIQLEKKGTSVDEDWAQEIIRGIYAEGDADQILYLAASAGLINRNGNAVRFVHQLLQEYFAAFEMGKEIQTGSPATLYWPSEFWWERTGWEESVILLAGMQRDASDVVKWLAPINPSLAFRCVKESGSDCSNEVLSLLYEPTPTSRSSPQARAEWGRILAEKGDNRPGTGLNIDGQPDIVWCEVPAGTAVIGGDPLVAVSHSRWDGAEINIGYTYWISRFLVTYSQYEAFVNDNGYTRDEFWSGTGLSWRGNQRHPKYWNDRRWHLANHPIVGVTWHEASAFCRWLNSRLSEKNRPAPNVEIRLPTESEWEKAARYPDSRSFPWGEKYIPGAANLDETNENNPAGPNYLRRTTAVGVYLQGASALGIYDLSGQVWEWSLSKYKDPYEFPEDNDPEGHALRALRGGSWFYDQDFARCASRARDHVGNRDYDVGFRLCASAPIVRDSLHRVTGTKNKVFGEKPEDIYGTTSPRKRTS